MRCLWKICLFLIITIPLISVAEARNSEELVTLIKKNDMHRRNISQMRVSSIERTIIILNAKIIARILLDLQRITLIQDLLKDHEDKKMVETFIALLKESAENECTTNLDTTNMILTQINNPALLDEAKNLRDVIYKSCDFVKNY